jgi:hypothetical protein
VKAAHCCRSRPPQDAAVRPVIADIRASCSIFAGGNVGMRTNPPFAVVAIADAAFVRSRSGVFFAVQRVSPKRPFKSAFRRQSQTVF